MRQKKKQSLFFLLRLLLSTAQLFAMHKFVNSTNYNKQLVDEMYNYLKNKYDQKKIIKNKQSANEMHEYLKQKYPSVETKKSTTKYNI